MLFGRFLAERRGGKTVWQAGQEDLRAYRRARRSGEGAVSASTWNRFIAALDKWAEWAVYEKLIEAPPFRYADVTVWTPHRPARIRVNAEREPGEESGPVRFLPYADYLRWRDVGLRGLLPDGSPDPAWRGRHGERNAAFADLMVGTGMRLCEASSLLVSELPPPGGRSRTGELPLPSSITKRNRARSAFVSQRVLRRVHQYADIERDELVARMLAGGAYDRAEGGSGPQRRVRRVKKASLLQPAVQRGAVRVVAPRAVPADVLGPAEQLLLNGGQSAEPGASPQRGDVITDGGPPVGVAEEHRLAGVLGVVT